MKNVYRLFGTELLITDGYRKEASENLKSWNTLHEYLTTGPDELDLMKLIVIEKEGKSRSQIISRLHSALTSARRKIEREELNAGE